MLKGLVTHVSPDVCRLLLYLFIHHISTPFSTPGVECVPASLDSFLEFCGEDEGQRRWATAGQQYAYRYFSVAFACVVFFCVYQRTFLSVCSISTRPLSARLSWALLSPYSPVGLTMSVAPLPILLSLQSLLASLCSCQAFHVALVV